MNVTSFNDLGLSAPFLKAVKLLGFENPSPIQAMTIPVALEGKDVLGISETGSGKTAAFGLPALEKINLNDHTTQALILCPTRELCVQVCEEIHRLGSQLDGFSTIPVYGGAPIDRQMKALKRGAHVVVGTPGRLMDLMKRRVFKTGAVKFVVLDEADRMLDMGFVDDMHEILGALPEDRQSMFFSATMSRDVEKLINQFGNEPQQIRVKSKELTVSTIDQSYFEVSRRSKIEVLSRLLDTNPVRLAVVFCNTKVMVDECCDALLARGYSADRIHGDIPQNIRERVIKTFRDGKIELLVATDVAARGLDIENLDMVFNYDIPYDAEDYVHRIGRTGRAGRSGKAVSFVFGKEIYRLESIERYTKHRLRRERIPSVEEVQGLKANQIFEDLKKRLESGKYERYGPLVDRLLEQGFSHTDVASGLFTLLQEKDARENELIAEDSNPNSTMERDRGRGRGGRRGDRPRRGQGNGGGGNKRAHSKHSHSSRSSIKGKRQSAEGKRGKGDQFSKRKKN